MLDAGLEATPIRIREPAELPETVVQILLGTGGRVALLRSARERVHLLERLRRVLVVALPQIQPRHPVEQ